MHPNADEMQLTQQLLLADHVQRRELNDWIIEQQIVNAHFMDKIIFGDELYFHLHGFINRHDCWLEKIHKILLWTIFL